MISFENMLLLSCLLALLRLKRRERREWREKGVNEMMLVHFWKDEKFCQRFTAFSLKLVIKRL